MSSTPSTAIALRSGTGFRSLFCSRMFWNSPRRCHPGKFLLEKLNKKVNGSQEFIRGPDYKLEYIALIILTLLFLGPG